MAKPKKVRKLPPKTLDPDIANFAQMGMRGTWPIFLNGDDTGLTARNAEDAAKMLSTVLIRRGSFNATIEALARTLQDPLDAYHFVWPPGSVAIVSKGAGRPKPKRRRK